MSRQKVDTNHGDSLRLGHTDQLRAEKAPDEAAYRKHAETLLRIERDLAIAFCSASDIDKAFQFVLEAVRKVETIDAGGVYLVDPKTRRLELAAHIGLSSAFARTVAKYEPDSPPARMVNEGKPRYVLLSEILPDMDDTCQYAGLRALGVFPLLNDGEVVGSLNVASRTHDELPLPTRNALEAIGAQAAGAIARLRAEESLRRSRDKLEKRVKDRTAELEDANERLHMEVAEREHIESALRVSEERFRQAFEEGPLGMALTNADGSFLKVNRAFCSMLKYSEAELSKKTITQIIHPDDLSTTCDLREQMLSGKIPGFKVKKRYVTKDGETIWAHVTVGSARNQNGDISYGISLVEDLSASQKTVEALRQSEERFQLIFQESPLGMVTIDTEGKCLQVNRTICHMLDRDPARIVGKPIADLGFSNISQFTSDELQRVTAGIIPSFTWESEFANRSGKTVWARITATAVHDQQGDLVCGVGMMEDITQHRTAELALRHSEELFRLAFEEGPLGVWIIDDEGKCRQVNRTFAQMIGYLPEELHGKLLLELTHLDDRRAQAEYLDRLLVGTCRRYTLEKRFLHKDGHSVWTRLTAAAVYDHDGAWLYGLGMVEDISHRKEVEEALRRAERLASIGTLAAGIAHEINNPLGAIVLSADAALLAREQTHGGEIVEASLRNIQAGALRCGRIVKNVLQFSRNEVSQKWLEDIGGIARRSRDITNRLAADAGVTVRLAIDDGLPRVVINPTEIEQVLVNIITNAIQASKPGDSVNVSAGRQGGNLVIAVEDNGVGMTIKQSERIFDPFYTTRQSTGGTGLGLSISHGIVQGHGGEIHFKSEPGAGTKMTVVLPIRRQ